MRATRHFRHVLQGNEYLQHQVRLMCRWCRIHGRTEVEFVTWHAYNYACRHGGAGAGGRLEPAAGVSAGSPEGSVTDVDEERS